VKLRRFWAKPQNQNAGPRASGAASGRCLGEREPLAVVRFGEAHDLPQRGGFGPDAASARARGARAQSHPWRW
jgi:hypothetical protein